MKYQQSFFSNPVVHGGTLGLNKRKGRRPLSTKKPIHVTLKSNFQQLRCTAKPMIESQIKKWSEHFDIRVYKFSIQGNHIHLCVRGKYISDLQNFFRVLAGQIAQRFSKIWKGVLPQDFWKYVVFTRIAGWGKAFEGLIAYIEKNELEALGVIQYKRTPS